MDGIITTRDVLKHLPLIWREFGARCAFNCIKAVVTRERTTFLDVACGVQRPAADKRTFRN